MRRDRTRQANARPHDPRQRSARTVRGLEAQAGHRLAEPGHQRPGLAPQRRHRHEAVVELRFDDEGRAGPGREAQLVAQRLPGRRRREGDAVFAGGGKPAAVEAGACPHTVIREDPTLNIAAADDLETRFPDVELILIESGGDNLASTFSLDLVDWWMFVIDVAGGDDIPRKNGPGVVKCDLLVINKTDLAPHVGADLARMTDEAAMARAGRPLALTNCRKGEGIEEVVDRIMGGVLFR